MLGGQLEWIHGDYREMPCLASTAEQARRPWALDEGRCRLAVDTLAR